MNGNWLIQSLVATAFLVPAWLAVGFFGRNYQVKPEIFLLWYMMGIIIVSALFGVSEKSALFPSWKIVGMIVIVGVAFGGIANVLLFSAVAYAPNPGLPIAISNGASLGVFLVAAFLAFWIPKYFSPVRIDIWSLAGIVLTIIGLAIIAIRR